MGDGWYGRSDLTVDLKIGRSLVMTVDNKTKRMTVTQDGKVIKTIPVSLGKKKTPSSSGTMVVIEKKRNTVFDTIEELGPDEGYRTEIDYAQRITWSGQFIHAAPWSEGAAGHGQRLARLRQRLDDDGRVAVRPHHASATRSRSRAPSAS